MATTHGWPRLLPGPRSADWQWQLPRLRARRSQPRASRAAVAEIASDRHPRAARWSILAPLLLGRT